jgi:hypothetical protein
MEKGGVLTLSTHALLYKIKCEKKGRFRDSETYDF